MPQLKPLGSSFRKNILPNGGTSHTQGNTEFFKGRVWHISVWVREGSKLLEVGHLPSMPVSLPMARASSLSLLLPVARRSGLHIMLGTLPTRGAREDG